ncbi:T9SS type A sorting domain-containing protein [candidate division WOR-3 bacterium]|nr:T9SS type A sorting domain-containing protein [candidate division WOR-3 bacterium]
MRFLKVFCFLAFFSTLLFAQSSDWGNDVRIMQGEITSFDCDYLSDGTMFAAVQKDTVVMSPDSYPVILYRSTNHGGSWHVFDTIQSLGKYERMKLLSSELGDDYLFIFCFNFNGMFNRLCVQRYNLTAHTLQSSELIDAWAWPNSFDATLYEHNGDSTISVIFWSEDSQLQIRHSDNRGITWYGTWFINAQGRAFDPDVSICRGPRNEIYTAWSASVQSQERDSLNLYGQIWDANTGGSIGDTFIIADQNKACVQPRIACSNDPNNPALWCAYTYEFDLYQNDLDVYVASVKTPDSADYGWAQTSISVSSQMESGPDLRFYKSYGNMYVNMTYLYHNLANDSTKIFWGWASGSNHVHWNFHTTFINDHPSHYIPNGTSPKICYSPGATGSGSAVMYSGYLENDLWIDAPWTLCVEETPENIPIGDFRVFPSVIRSNSSVFLVLPLDCIYKSVIFDITGRPVQQSGEIQGTKGVNSIEIDNLPSGIYFLEINQAEQIPLKTRIMVI